MILDFVFFGMLIGIGYYCGRNDKGPTGQQPAQRNYLSDALKQK